ncbi:hybrid sensor histidine kinase/response regulator [Dethiosulfatarculus sandiegensis]|uniref:histidine kinase n=1 Tax=Dethiosulfatarculus sandiegensis TaxID=1429043 RepID=A0A0D2JDQ0_9BACT|nr:response regulator [Dethiosulfatarculus sandiegensis]KIX13811.1 histidine kinase [Dethiosulfatarculus sandiegensis]
MGNKSLFTYISLTVSSLVICATLVMAGLIYLGLATQLKREFQNRVQAQAEAAAQRYDHLMNLAASRLRELSLDNTIRVTLMLGVHQQLKERLAQMGSTNKAIIFFVTDKNQNIIFKSDQGDFNQSTIKALLAAAPHTEGLIKNPGRGFSLGMSLPIKRKNETLGAAACLLRLMAPPMSHTKGAVGLSIAGEYLDIYTGEKINTSLYSTPVGLPGAHPGLFFLAGLSEYKKSQTRIFLLVSLATGGVLLISILVSLVISHKLSSPLKKLSLKALAIARGEQASGLGIMPSGITELEQLSNSLDTMLVQLKKADELKRYQTLFKGVGDIVTIHDHQGNFLEVNQVAAESLGFTREVLLGMNVGQVVPVYNAPGFREDVRKSIAQKGKAVKEVEFKARGGKLRATEIHVRPVTYLGQKAFLSVGRDITKRIRLENQLRQAQKMEAIGTLAGGIAHDFNNILTSILGYTELAQKKAQGSPDVVQNLDQVLTAGKRAKAVVRQILTFSRRSTQERKPIELSLVIKEALKLLRASLPSTIEIVQEIKADYSMVMADPTQIHQVLLNLCTNAAQAMESTGGVLTVSLELISISAPTPKMIHEGAGTLSQGQIKPGEYIKLTIKDNGPGLEPEFLDRIFEPYFTTKGSADGTGLGLAVVHGIITGHGGSIEVESRPGRGSAFMVLLPLIRQTALPSQTISDSPLPTGSESVLLVDDEVPVAELEREILEGLGYRVTAMTSSQKALELFKEKPNRFDLVITDQTMPNLTGMELTKQIKQIRPEQPVVLCTGYQERMDEKRALEMGFAGFALKPILMREIAQTVRQALDRNSNSQNTFQ